MPKGILGIKLGITQVFDEEGRLVPVTAIEAGPCVVVQKKTKDNDGYTAVQLGFGDIRESLLTRPERGHFKRVQVKPRRYLREFRVKDDSPYSVGDDVKVDIFDKGDLVDVVGTSLGKGFAGVIKRWNFRRGAMAHGSMYHRRVGTLGATDQARVFKGKRMPGRMGARRVTIQNLEVVKVDPERNLLLVKGSIPGRRGALLLVKESVKTSVKKKR